MKAKVEQGQRNGRVKADFSPERHIRGSYELFCDDGVTEIRSFDDHGATYSGYFDNADEFAAALKQDAANRTTYVTLNPVNPALLAKCNNRSKKVIGRKGTTTPDKHIQRRRWVLVDCDPVRPADVPSTKEEKAASMSPSRASSPR